MAHIAQALLAINFLITGLIGLGVVDRFLTRLFGEWAAWAYSSALALLLVAAWCVP